MTRRYICMLLALSFLWFGAGCATFGARPNTGGEEQNAAAAEAKKKPGYDAQTQTSIPPVNPAILYEEAHKLFIESVELTQAEKYPEAFALNNRLIRMLMEPIDRAADEATAKRLDSLFFEVCLSQVRIGRLTGRFAPMPPEQKLIGIDYNAQVETWLSYYLVTGRSSMERYLSRAHRYLPMIKAVLKEEGLPEDLAYLPIIESGYSPYAYSPAAACGIWQFIGSTGRNYGLTINEWVDERRDPIKSTRAAARYLKDLHNNFNDWALALAGYNCGENCVARALNASGSRSFWNLSLPAETTAYVPKFFASVLIAREPETYGLYLTPEPQLAIAQIELTGVVELKTFADFVGISYEELKGINPELLGTHTPPDQPKYKINVPDEKAEEVAKKLADLQPGQLYVEPQQLAKLKSPETSAGFIVYRVKKGDTLGSIARRYHTSVAAIQRHNRVSAKALRVGMKLKIPVGRKR
ncbi:MAG: transglycosylase SLT domain-containing protein [Myxococcales bacterium]|nr:transglycosylase SLT domain-containing protein [Myxococcales bacterium]